MPLINYSFMKILGAKRNRTKFYNNFKDTYLGARRAYTFSFFLFRLSLSTYRLTTATFTELTIHSKIILFFTFFLFLFTISLWVWTYSSDDCACHFAVLALGGSAISPVRLIPKSSENSGTVSDRN